MKKKLIIILIVLVGGALIIIPLIKSNPIEIVELKPAIFDMGVDGGIGTFVGKKSTIKIKLNENDLSEVELVYDSKVIQSWESPKGSLSFDFTPDRVGTYLMQVVSTNKDGRKISDDKNFRVLSDINPEKLKVEIINTFPHDNTSYTQGLEFYEGRIFESTGLYGSSKISELNLQTGQPKDGFTQKLDGTYFGEGITILNDLLYQLTWKKGKCFVYSLDGQLQLIDDFDFVGQDGWGLCNDGASLIMSDGTERLTFRNPKTFQIEKTIDVYNNRGAMTQLNELEYVDGKIYANIYQTNLIVLIDPDTGKILQEIDCTNLERVGRGNGDVLNGIAFNSETEKMYVTGKNWNSLFEVNFVKQ